MASTCFYFSSSSLRISALMLNDAMITFGTGSVIELPGVDGLGGGGGGTGAGGGRRDGKLRVKEKAPRES